MKTVVVKIGTSSLINEFEDDKTYLNLRSISSVVDICCTLKRKGYNVILVSSGSVGCGRHVLDIKSPPKTLHARQALAAIGQVHLMSKYESMFGALKETCAQVLITYETFRNREHYLNAETTITQLFQLETIPIVNENDTVATQELRSENDTLSAMVASMVSADYLFLLTDVEGLYTANPKTDSTARLVKVVENEEALENLLESLELKGGSSWGSGGMTVKINAAKLAASLGIQTTILSSKRIFEIESFLVEKPEFQTGTTFIANPTPPNKRKGWIKGLRCRGEIYLDDGAVQAVINKNDLHAVGITGVKGIFPAYCPVKLCDKNKEEIGRALVNYKSTALELIKGLHTDDILKMKVVFNGPVISRKNVVVTSLKVNRDQESSFFD